MKLIDKIKKAVMDEMVDFSIHAEYEMEHEEFGIIWVDEVLQAILNGRIIENYPDTFPLPTCLINGKTDIGRPIHVVCAYSEDEDITIIVTTYQPDPNLWIDYRRRI
ncbi:MAG: DUF4258 domain-containing protein [Methanosarcinales archaeon]